mmetsp:Transcript_1950/g.2724  ORF Transcript_1950/g.2724 Transcript_1950/m.2724 type:complete len:112 (-) Transcript_1950:35-370(-)
MEEEILSEDTVMECLRLEAAFGVNLEEEVEVWVKLLLLRQERAQLEQQQERAAALDWVLVWQLLETLALHKEMALVETGDYDLFMVALKNTNYVFPNARNDTILCVFKVSM